MGDLSGEPQAVVPVIPPSSGSETSPLLAATEIPQEEPMVCSSLAKVPSELPQVQPASESKAVEVPPELPHVQLASALESIETKAEGPVVPVSTGDSNVVEEAMKMEPLLLSLPPQVTATQSGKCLCPSFICPFLISISDYGYHIHCLSQYKLGPID